MRPRTLSLTVLIACCTALQAAAQAPQKETEYLDAGYLRLKKDFTQNIVISGTDLEKMPFGNLSEALSPWLLGAYTQPGALQYVVDGNRVTDVNAYSVHDIEEVVLVQNAAALGGTAGGQQQLVLIRTKRGKAPYGFTANAQSGLVNAGSNGASTKTRVYHDYYLGGWRNWKKLSVGLSANWTRDVFPMTMPANDIESTPFNLQRWRLNGHADYQLNKNNIVGISMNFTSGQVNYEYDSANAVPTQAVYTGWPPGTTTGAAHQQLAAPSLYWKGVYFNRLRNDLTATYLLTRFTSATNQAQQFENGSGLWEGAGNENSERRSHHLWVRDRLSYTASKNDWTFEPSLDLSFEHIDFFASNAQSISYGAVNPPPPNTIPIYYLFASADYQNTKFNIFLATPTIDLSYKKIFDVVGGAQVAPTNWEYSTSKKVFPFASATLDVLHLANPDAGASLKLFGSYAQRAVQSIHDYTLMDVSNGLNVNQPFPWYYGAIYTGTPALYAPMMDSTFSYGIDGKVLVGKDYPVTDYWVWSAGASYSMLQDRIQFQYNFQRRNFSTAGVYRVSATDSLAVFPQWHSTLHHADIRARIIDTKDLSFTTDINLTLLRNSQTNPSSSITPGKPVVGDVSPDSWSYTGGWTNRLRIKDFSAGLDLLYHFGEKTNAQRSVNSVLLPNIYAGYQWRLKHQRAVEFFLQSRGLYYTSSNDLLDQRRYYTVGGKFTL